MAKSRVYFLIAIILLCLVKSVRTQDVDWQLWSDMFVKTIRTDHKFDYSGEYQVRINNNFKNLKSHFVEFNTYYKFTSHFVLNGGYRFTLRPDHCESRLMAGLFWQYLPGKDPYNREYDKRIRITPQLMYQHDFNAMFNDILLNSNSIRLVFWVLKPINKTIAPLAAAAIMYTWNNEYNGLEKIRFVAGVQFTRSNADRIKVHYVYEIKNSVDPALVANIIWLRYEILIP